MKLTRRELLGAGLASASTLACAVGPEVQRGRRAKNIIFCVSDGMSAATMSMADQFQREVYGKESYWAWLMEQPWAVNGLQVTRSLGSVVTDSSAASSAWGSGRRIWNGHVNYFPDGTLLRPIADIVHAAGMRSGLVTTTTMTHATPSGFAVACKHRELEPLIAELHLKAGVDVLLGGGDKFFSASKRADKRDLYSEFVAKGYNVVKERKELMAAARRGKTLGIFSNSHVPFTVDRDNDDALKATVPTLAEMASFAIDSLKDTSKGFLLQIEGGKVDHGGHANDLAAMLYDQIAFEEAVKVAVEFARKDGNTLVVVTADHATGGPSLNGAGFEYFDSTAGLKLLSGMKASYGVLVAAMGEKPAPAKVKEVVEAKLGIVLTQDEAELVSEASNKTWAKGLSSFERSLEAVLGIALGNHSKVQWTSNNHTSDHVLLTSMGPGADMLAGLTPNMTIFDIMLAQKGLKFSNPTMTYEEAARLMAREPKVAAHSDPEEAKLWA